VADLLKRIYASASAHSAEAEQREPYEAVRERALARRAERRPFLDALRRSDGTAIVAEIKRASPSAGLIARNFDPAKIARRYDTAGADAISVLTEQDNFLGDLAFLDIVRAVTQRSLLRKDFLSRRYDVAQSAAYGADCILLIVSGLDDRELTECLDEAGAYALDVLVEVHDEDELQRALGLGARFVGVNNRDLRTLATDLAVSELLLPSVPRDIFAISESGMREPEDLRRLSLAGARGFLIGESLMRAEDPEQLIRVLRASLVAEHVK
jgi:indole-3-glycerol phosphate synthase